MKLPSKLNSLASRRAVEPSDFVMYLLLLLAIGASTASPLGFQGTPMNVTLPLLVSCAPPKRASRFDPDCCSYDDLVASVCASQKRSRGPARFQLCHLTAHNFEVYCLTHLPQWAVTFLAPQTGPRTATIVSLHKSTEHAGRAPDKSRAAEQCSCCRLCS